MSPHAKSTEEKLALADGRSTIVERWGESPSILCVHGIASSRKAWTRLADAISARYPMMAYDQAGHGDAAAVDGSMTLQRCIEDACAVARSSASPIRTLIGHSWGGAVVLMAALQLPSAETVIAIDPMIYVAPGTWDVEYLDDVKADLRLSEEEREGVLRSRLSNWDALDIAGKLHAMRSMRPEAIERLGRDNRVDEGGWNLRPLVTSYPKRCLVTAAARSDSVLAAEDFALLRDRTRNPKCTVVEFETEGHNLHRTAFPEFVRVVTSFIGAGD